MTHPVENRANAVLDPILDRTPSHAGSPPDDSNVYAMPATQGQIRFWSLDQLNPGNPALNMPLMWQCKGPLDAERLRRAFTLCVERHEMLRTTFELVDGRLTQIIGPAYEVAIPLEDLSHLPDAANSAQARRSIRAHAAFRMNLQNGPLLELKLLKFTAQHHLLLVTMHHIICDGISLGILLRDAAVFYEAMASGAEAELPELPIQFGDYAVWAEEWRASDEAGRSIEFWRKTLGKDFDRLQLNRDPMPEQEAVDADRPGLSAETGDIETLLIPADLVAAAHKFCKHENVTFNILLTSVFTALMSRLSGQLDLVIGSPCANRTEDTAELIGLFMNIQVMRIRMEQETTFRSLLKQVQEWTLGAFENQTLPFEDLVHDTFFGERNNAFEIPVFFLYQKSFMVTQRVAGLEITPLRSESPGAVFELMFAIVDRAEEGPRLQLEYNPQHFRQETIQRYLKVFVALLESALTVPDVRVDQLWMLQPVERDMIVHGWNETEVDFGGFDSIQELFNRRAETHPSEMAVMCGKSRWTYATLHRYATGLAGRLVREGLQPGDLVGICVDRSPEMLGAVLAVLMAGGAYVPLDPRHPADRLQMVVEDSGMAFLLTRTAKELQLKLKAGARVLDLKATVPENGPAMAISLPVEVSPSSLAYVIYTSGSTGRPKGVAIEHGALMNLLNAMQGVTAIGEKDTLVAVTTLAFDIATLELLLPMMTGAKLVIASDSQVQDGNQLAALLEQSKATILQATPGAWRMLIDAGWNGQQPLQVLCGGEAMPRDLADRLLDRSTKVWNVYGPTETTIWSSATRVTRGKGPVLLGPPLANTQFYILDKELRPVPMGVPGELYIGGSGLARGYWKRPELTAEKFTQNPFAPGRMYATGDLGLWTPAGLIQLLGRSDFQVKIRGYRVELGEIESLLSGNAKVREAVVIHHTTQPEEGGAPITRLVAYVDSVRTVQAGAEAELIAELQKCLRAKLPEYLCPNAIVVLEEMPRTPNGKVDRKALPEVFLKAGNNGLTMSAVPAMEFTPPKDTIERQLVEIWQSTLGIKKISTRASFFSLGVGSLAALRLINHMNRVYALDLGLASLISASTIESVAQLVRTRFAPNTSSSLVPIQPHGTRPPLFIVHGIGGNIVNFYSLSMRMGREQPVFGVQAQALEVGQPALLHLKDMAAHYLEEIRQVQPEGPYYLLGYSFGGTVVLEMAHQLRAAGQEVALVGMLDSKSRDYLAELSKTVSMQSKINRRVGQFAGNTSRLSVRERVSYMWGKVKTRAIRYSVWVAAACKMKQVPAFMKSATDINYVAAQNYRLSPFDGRVTLFRASEQDDPHAPRDLGWNAIFSRGVDVRELPGDHERIFLEPGIDVLVDSLRDALRAAHAAQFARKTQIASQMGSHP